jgi:hypothetical protein
MESRISELQLAEIINNHELWLTTSKQQGTQADFRGKYLRKANLTGRTLAEANFSKSSSYRANFTDANLTHIDFSEAIFSEANFSNAGIIKGNFAKSEFNNGNFTDACLHQANFADAYLFKVNFTNAYLVGANFAGANLALVFGVKFPPKNHEMIAQIAKNVLSNPDVLDMDVYHSQCGTVHCIAGWCSVLCGMEYETQENNTQVNAHTIASYVLGEEARSHFYDTTEQAIAWLKTKL